jgi:hypothetical protein
MKSAKVTDLEYITWIRIATTTAILERAAGR